MSGGILFWTFTDSVRWDDERLAEFRDPVMPRVSG